MTKFIRSFPKNRLEDLTEIKSYLDSCDTPHKQRKFIKLLNISTVNTLLQHYLDTPNPKAIMLILNQYPHYFDDPEIAPKLVHLLKLGKANQQSLIHLHTMLISTCSKDSLFFDLTFESLDSIFMSFSPLSKQNSAEKKLIHSYFEKFKSKLASLDLNTLLLIHEKSKASEISDILVSRFKDNASDREKILETPILKEKFYKNFASKDISIITDILNTLTPEDPLYSIAKNDFAETLYSLDYDAIRTPHIQLLLDTFFLTPEVTIAFFQRWDLEYLSEAQKQRVTANPDHISTCVEKTLSHINLARSLANTSEAYKHEFILEQFITNFPAILDNSRLIRQILKSQLFNNTLITIQIQLLAKLDPASPLYSDIVDHDLPAMLDRVKKQPNCSFTPQFYERFKPELLKRHFVDTCMIYKGPTYYADFFPDSESDDDLETQTQRIKALCAAYQNYPSTQSHLDPVMEYVLDKNPNLLFPELLALDTLSERLFAWCLNKLDSSPFTETFLERFHFKVSSLSPISKKYLQQNNPSLYSRLFPNSQILGIENQWNLFLQIGGDIEREAFIRNSQHILIGTNPHGQTLLEHLLSNSSIKPKDTPKILFLIRHTSKPKLTDIYNDLKKRLPTFGKMMTNIYDTIEQAIS